MADISCLEDAEFAQNAGADVFGTTLAGYIEHGRPALSNPDLDFLGALVSTMRLPTIAEGRYEQYRA